MYCTNPNSVLYSCLGPRLAGVRVPEDKVKVVVYRIPGTRVYDHDVNRNVLVLYKYRVWAVVRWYRSSGRSKSLGDGYHTYRYSTSVVGHHKISHFYQYNSIIYWWYLVRGSYSNTSDTAVLARRSPCTVMYCGSFPHGLIGGDSFG